MSASPSSLIDLSVDQPTIVGSAGSLAVDDVPADLLIALSAVTDPRCRRGVRHQLVVVLGVAVCAVLGGARSYVAIAEWATDLPEVVRERLGIRRVPPSESAIRRVLQAVDPVLLNRAVVGWLNSHATPRHAVTGRGRRGWTVIAVDGKTMRGARLPGGRQTHLLAAVETTAGTVAAQTVVDGKTNEISMFAPLLDQLHDLTDVIVTADALHTQRGHAEYLHGRGAHYVFTVKANQPTLLAQLRSLPWASVPTVDVTRGKAHGRVETRTLKLTAVDLGGTGISFPHAALAAKIVRRRRSLGRGQRWSTETVYVVTDLTFAQIGSDQLADIIRGHWGIENRLHWVRDVVFDEDRSQIRTGHGPAVMAALRNLAIGVLRRAGATNIAAATRKLTRHPARTLTLLLQPGPARS